MRICTGCAVENSDAAKFCKGCGKALDSTLCKACGIALKPESRFCKNCGAPVQEQVPQKSPQDEKLTAAPAGPVPTTGPFAELYGLIGLTSVKDSVEKLGKLIRFNELRRRAGKPADSISTHSVFLGSPGTGKTTVARILANIFKELGLLSAGHLVEVDRSGLVAGYEGQTAIKTAEVIDRAQGGVLFIDEAYSLANDSFGREAIATLLKRMEDDRGSFSVIVAGYAKEMEDFFNSNSGLRSRFEHTFVFEDYNAEEMHRIARKLLEDKAFEITPEADKKLAGVLERIYAERDAAFANGRTVRQLVEGTIRNLAARVVDSQASSGDALSTIVLADVPGEAAQTARAKEDVLRDLESLVGLSQVKTAVKDLIAFLEVQRGRRDSGLKTEGVSLHCVFLGNPGTGKTTVARLLAEILSILGFIPKGHLVETGPADMIGGYLGQSEQKTRELLDQAMGGVLLIDEAYSLAKSEYGRQAINVLLKRMEDDRDKFVVIATGYRKEMADFFAANTGLQSRFSRVFEFDDYSPDDMMAICDSLALRAEFKFTESARDELRRIFSASYESRAAGFGNGRFVRQVFEAARLAQSRRLAGLEAGLKEVSREMYTTIDGPDVSQAHLPDAVASPGTLKSIVDQIQSLLSRVPAELHSGFAENILVVAYMLAVADGTFSDEEAQAVSALCTELGAAMPVFKEYGGRMQTPEHTRTFLKQTALDEAGRFKLRLPGPERLGPDASLLLRSALFRVAVLVAESEGKVNSQEKDALKKLKKALGLDG